MTERVKEKRNSRGTKRSNQLINKNNEKKEEEKVEWEKNRISIRLDEFIDLKIYSLIFVLIKVIYGVNQFC